MKSQIFEARQNQEIKILETKSSNEQKSGIQDFRKLNS